MRFLSLILPLLFPLFVFTQSKSDIISNIRKEFKNINGTNDFEVIILENEDFLDNATDGGGKLTGYYKNNSLKKVVVSVGLSHGIETLEFYFQNSSLIFVYEKFEGFVFDEKKSSFDYTKTIKSFEGRYYFNKKKLVDYITTGHNRFEDDSLDPENVLLKEANDYVILLNNKKIRLKGSSNTD
jgi:hypothetical protein